MMKHQGFSNHLKIIHRRSVQIPFRTYVLQQTSLLLAPPVLHSGEGQGPAGLAGLEGPEAVDTQTGRAHEDHPSTDQMVNNYK